MSIAPDLSLVWKRAVDPHNGSEYFYCPHTKQTAWKLPKNAVFMEEAGSWSAGANQQQQPQQQQPQLWKKKHDQVTNKAYYFCPQTKQTSWTLPDSAILVHDDCETKQTAAQPLPNSTASDDH